MSVFARQLLWGMLFTGFVYAQTGQISGIIKDAASKRPVPNAIIKIESSGQSCQCDEDGAFFLGKVPVGKYYLIFMAKGYYSLIIPDIKVEADKTTHLKIEMYVGNESEYLFLNIGGIKVTAERELLSKEAETVHSISQGEIEHMQANSLSDVLEMIPGNERTTNLGLQSKQSITLRSFNNAQDDGGALFGTRIIVDDVPLSNNVNLQTGVGVGYGSGIITSAGGQYDLREIAAENLEKVEVLSGAASAEYGDYSQGLVLVKTRTRGVPTRLKLKNNPDTREANLMGSFHAINTDFVYNFNYGYSERDIRVQGDEYHRIAASLKSSNKFLQKRIRFDQSLRFNRRIEEDNDASDPTGVKAYNRDQHWIYSHILDWQLNENSQLYMRNYVDYQRRNSWRHQLETADLAYLTDRYEPGTREAILSEPVYESDVTTIGDEWGFGSKIKFSGKFFSGSILHRVFLGAEFIAEENNGPGKSFNILRPPNGKQGERPRSFSQIPGFTNFSFFMEDRISGKMVFPFTLNLGLRLDSYNPTGFDITALGGKGDLFKAEQGTFANPRIGLQVKFTPKTQLRFTFSKASKRPALARVYPAPFYLDTYDYTIQSITDSSGTRDTTITLVTTQVFDKSAPNLKGYQSTKYEIALDQKVGPVGLSLLGYYQESNRIPRDVFVPFTYHRYYWPNWPNTQDKQALDTINTIQTRYMIPQNLSWTVDRGLEFTLRSHRLPGLNMIFRINASFNHRKYGNEWFPDYRDSRIISSGDTLEDGSIVEKDMQVVPFYTRPQKWRQKMVINYFIDYIAKPLGIWIRLKAQQVLYEQNLKAIDPKLSADGYYYNGEQYFISSETSARLGLNRAYSDLALTVDKSKNFPKWLFGVTVSKSLWQGAEISFFVENIFNNRIYYLNRYGFYDTRNPEIFWGVAFSAVLDNLF